ncbi:ornithine carbamoyltransferase [Candidatus Omnitrophus magneticus]|uniref:Ornithine carbamoyltransferase n=1 Tax=Candidatus Omnitrophus magneticus TaxID=1609969 RepID=A0A0F0CP70_9BACT|nr:ornithine carbamoyltransferase [Candidatus Omnitrophus magneticus]
MRKKRDLLTLKDLTVDEIFEIMSLAKQFKRFPFFKKRALRNKTLALLFQKPSNRTRVSFEVAMTHLGGYALYLSPQEIAMGARESVKDVACVISRYVDGIVARVFSHNDLSIFSRYADIPVINGLSDLAHPCQALSDIFTIKEKFGVLKGVKLTYVGDGNNVANSLLITGVMAGLNVSIATPKGYEIPVEVLEEAKEHSKISGSIIEILNEPEKAMQDADVVYTDVWISMGDEHEKEERLKAFSGFQINETLMSYAKKYAFIMHCLPAHRGEEISDVIDGKNSIVYDQAENRMHVQKAVLYKLLR